MKKRTTIWIYPTIMLLMIINSCKKDATPKVPVLSTSVITAITQSSAICGGTITSDEGKAVTERGVCWSTGQTPTINDERTIDGSGTGSFSSNLVGLLPYTSYYVRAYATNSDGTGYGNAVSFTTKKEDITVVDIDGNSYKTVTIGTQVWMAENLRTTKYRDNTDIPYVSDYTAWSNITSGACCDIDNTPSNSATLGKLYNWSAVTDLHNICPDGWHIPTNAENNTLVDFLGGWIVAGGKLKETGTSHWQTPNTGATNETGFTALPTGMRSPTGYYIFQGEYGYWWNNDEFDADNAYVMTLNYSGALISLSHFYKSMGFPIRCIKD